ncbi:hypothetical protein D3C71_1513270 [compost metagenome]
MAQLFFNTFLNRAHRFIQRTRQRGFELIKAQCQLATDFALCIQHDQLAGGADFAQHNLRLPFVIQHQLTHFGLLAVSQVETFNARQIENVISVKNMANSLLNGVFLL